MKYLGDYQEIVIRLIWNLERENKISKVEKNSILDNLFNEDLLRNYILVLVRRL
jgi:hypothetical protein